MGRHASGHAFVAILVGALLTAGLALGPTRVEAAAELERPEGEVVLTVTGNLTRKNAPNGAVFDMAMLQRLGAMTLRTSTPWTEGKTEFHGVLVRDLLALVGAQGSTVTALALNDYSFDIDIDDFHRFPVILASEVDGRALTARDKGPLWIVYPLDDLSGSEKEAVEKRMVWQLIQIQVR